MQLGLDFGHEADGFDALPQRAESGFLASSDGEAQGLEDASSANLPLDITDPDDPKNNPDAKPNVKSKAQLPEISEEEDQTRAQARQELDEAALREKIAKLPMILPGLLLWPAGWHR